MPKTKKKMLLLFGLISVLLLALDQGTKYLATTYLKDQESISLIKGVLELHYLENRGAAFGVLQGQKFFILFVGIVFLALILFCLFRLPDKPKFHALYYVAGVMVSGAIGNMIDRMHLDYVVDFIYFSLIDFPIFNVADISITLSAITLAIMILFVYKEEDFSFLNFKQKKYREIK